MKYYWTVVHKGTGEISENAIGYVSSNKALKGGMKHAWRLMNFPGEVLVEIWTKPNAYSEPAGDGPVVWRYIQTLDKYVDPEEESWDRRVADWKSEDAMRRRVWSEEDPEGIAEAFDSLEEALDFYRSLEWEERRIKKIFGEE